MEHQFTPPQKDIDNATMLWAHYPFRRCWLAYPPGQVEDGQVILDPTSRLANRHTRDGWKVFELSRGAAG